MSVLFDCLYVCYSSVCYLSLFSFAFVGVLFLFLFVVLFFLLAFFVVLFYLLLLSVDVHIGTYVWILAKKVNHIIIRSVGQ